MHNENVIKYFKSRNRSHDLLILNVEKDKTPYDKLAKFLGCPKSAYNSSDFPHWNAADESQATQFIGKDVDLDWRNYRFIDDELQALIHPPVP